MAPPPPKKTISPGTFGLVLAGTLALVVALFQSELRHSFRPPDILISEIMAANQATLADPNGDHPDWIELYNPTTRTQQLAGWHLTDDFRLPRKWTFPDVSIAPGGFLVVFASGTSRTHAGEPLHASFNLDPQGEYLALLRPDGATVVDEYLPKYPPLDPDVSFGLRASQFAPAARSTAGRDYRRHAYFVAPTPGRANGEEMLGRVADTRFNHPRGIQHQPFEVTIASATPGAEIRYTTNGAAPTQNNGMLYRDPIPVATTTVLRAAAFKPGFKPTAIDTLTFLFTSQVPAQTGAGFPTTWGVRNGAAVQADYEMDPEIVQHPAYHDRIQPALASLPSLSLVLDNADLFDPTHGIYANPLETGPAWERPASLELLPHAGTRGFQARCGVRIQGGWSRRPEESPKHSFRIEFRDRYGPALLDYPLFGRGPRRFQSLVLRAGCNNSWLHWNGEERRRGELLRDQFMRDSLAALDHPSARGTFVHLYLNGLYWGIYNLCERPDAAFLAAHLGGTAADYESRNAGNPLTGDEIAWNHIFDLAKAGLDQPDRYQEVTSLLDIPAFCRFMLVQIYGGTSDWDAASNWYAGRRARPSGKYHFLVWDSERSLESVEANILDVGDDRSPTGLFQHLRTNATFRATFAQIARRNLENGGPLAPPAARDRFARLAATLAPAMVAESARWGDYRRDVHPYREGPYELYTVGDHWQPEINRLLDDYFPRRAAEVIRQLRQAGLY